jgi:hypothetical protein
MISPLIKKDKLALLIAWSFFSFSVVSFTFIFSYFIQRWFYYALFYTLLYFSYYFLFRAKFKIELTFWQYTVSNMVFVGLVTLFSLVYHKLIMLDSDRFEVKFFIVVLMANLFPGSLLYLFTLIGKK